MTCLGQSRGGATPCRRFPERLHRRCPEISVMFLEAMNDFFTQDRIAEGCRRVRVQAGG